MKERLGALMLMGGAAHGRDVMVTSAVGASQAVAVRATEETAQAIGTMTRS